MHAHFGSVGLCRWLPSLPKKQRLWSSLRMPRSGVHRRPCSQKGRSSPCWTVIQPNRDFLQCGCRFRTVTAYLRIFIRVDEHVTVTSGKFQVGMGDTFDAAKLSTLPVAPAG